MRKHGKEGWRRKSPRIERLSGHANADELHVKADTQDGLGLSTSELQRQKKGQAKKALFRDEPKAHP